MSTFINTQVYGVPLITYGLVGLTTAVLAYATATSDLGNVVSEAASSLTEVVENPVGAFSTSSEPASKPEDTSAQVESPLEGLNPFTSPSDEKTEPTEEESVKEEPAKEEPKPSSEMAGGKKRRRKKSFRRKSNKATHKRKSKKNKSQK